MSDNLFELFAARFPGDRAAEFLRTPTGRRCSYAELDERSARLAAVLRAEGVQPGDRVAVQVEKSPEALFLYLACLRVGAVFLPLNTAYRPQELEYFLGDAEPALTVCGPQAAAVVTGLATAAGCRRVFTLDADGGGSLAEAAVAAAPDPEVTPRGPDDIAAILYSSGTTGRPKGAMLTHRNLASNARTLVRAWGFRPGDVLLHALPIFHAHGLFVAGHCALLNGSRMIFLPKFDAEQVAALLPEATVFMGVPTFYVRLLALPEFGADTCRHIRLFVSGSAPLAAETFEEFRRRTGHAILERYGMTETTMNISNPYEGERRAGTVGQPLPGVEVRVADSDDRPLADGEVGELQVRGPNVFKGYWRQPEKTAAEFTADGFFRTGDLGRRDPGDGYITIVGRAKDMIISGGYNVYPREIEDVIDALDGVAESAVVGMPHADFGEAGLAVVVRRPQRTQPDGAAVLAACRDSLANYKVPKLVVFADELPRNTMGKVQKNALRDRYQEEWDRHVRGAA